MSEHHLYLIDGYGFVFRAYHSLPPMSRNDGTPTNAVYGFTNMLLTLKQRAINEGASKILIAFDAGSKTFRNDIYPEYKANRPPAPEDLIPQFPLIHEAAKALNLPAVSIVGYEADDIIATYSKQASNLGYKVTIVSSDKDLMQLVNDKVEMYDAMKKKTIGQNEVAEKFGVTPNRVLDVLAMMGDSSDNIPGIPGIGPKTAAELVNLYGDLESVLANASEIKQNKRRENIIEFADQARLSYKLASLCFDVPMDIAIDNLGVKELDGPQLIEFLDKQGFKSLIAKIGHAPKHSYPTANTSQKNSSAPKDTIKNPEEYLLIKDAAQLDQWLRNTLDSGMLAQQWKKDKQGKLLGYSFAYAQGKACYVPIACIESEQSDLFGNAPTKASPYLSKEQVMQALAAYNMHPAIVKIGHDIKPVAHIHPIDDIAVMSYVLDGSKHKHELAALSLQTLEMNIALPEEITKSKTPLGEIDPIELKQAFSQQADAILQLYEHFHKRLFTEKMQTIYYTIERPLIEVLSAMEINGIKVDPTILKKLSDEFSQRIEQHEKTIFSLAGKEFNIGSPKQLGEILFDEMSIEGGKKSKNGSYKTGADILEALAAQGHTIADELLKWRGLSKLRSTYTDALVKEIHPKTHRVHTNFSMTSTSTGRLSSLNPNLQNIPIRSEDGRKIRNAFVADKGNLLIGADYSQIELRLLAHMADIDSLKHAFLQGQDIHAKTASQVFNVPLEEVDSNRRRQAKAINFGIIYGQSAFGLANQLGISRGEAKDYIDAYFAQYPGIRHYMENTKEYAREHGYVTTLFGRKCYLNGIDSSNGAIRAFAERAAINAPLQGTAADIIKKAMIALFNRLVEEKNPARLLLQVHDELILETSKEHAPALMDMVQKEMEQIAQLSVPLTVDVKSGTHWGEIH